jgi:glycosyltransferase involved in cell wall biosynthesis
MSTPTASIILPVYNNGPHVERAIRSVLEQTCREIELVAVDDGSTDDSWAVISRIAKTDTRLLPVMLKSNQGVHRARWEGIQHSTGAYLGFLDADDWIERDTVEYVQREFGDADIGIVGMWMARSDNEKARARARFRCREVHTENLVRQFGRWKFATGSVCNKYYRRDLLEETSIWELPERLDCNEDYLVNFHAFTRAKRVVTLPGMKYFAFERRGSATRTDQPANLFTKALMASATCFEIYSDQPETLNAIDDFYQKVLRFANYRQDPSERVDFGEYRIDLQRHLERIAKARPEFFYHAFQWRPAHGADRSGPRIGMVARIRRAVAGRLKGIL